MRFTQPNLLGISSRQETVYNYSMKTEIQYRWRILWSGHWATTGHHCTEEQIRKEHPEAVRIDASRRELLVADTFDERKNVMFPGHSFVMQPAGESK